MQAECQSYSNMYFYFTIYSKGLQRIWLGSTDVQQEGIWEWLTGRCPFSSFQNWYPGEPSNSAYWGGEHCLELLTFDDGENSGMMCLVVF